MKIKLLTLFLILFVLNFASAKSFDQVDKLYREGNYNEGLKIIEKDFNHSNPDPEIIWRISRFYFEIADETDKKNKKDKIANFTKGMDVAKQFLEITYGEKLTRAEIIFWYTANYGSRGETIGIKESLDIVPELFNLADKALALDPTFAAPYLLKGRIDSAVPSFLGGDKFRMGVNLSKAIYYNSEDMSVLVDSSVAFLNRDWSVSDKKKKGVNKSGETDGTPADMSDKDYAKKLLNHAMDAYKSLENPTKRETLKLKEANNLLAKLK
jgi:hypothetical protein